MKLNFTIRDMYPTKEMFRMNSDMKKLEKLELELRANFIVSDVECEYHINNTAKLKIMVWNVFDDTFIGDSTIISISSEQLAFPYEYLRDYVIGLLALMYADKIRKYCAFAHQYSLKEYYNLEVKDNEQNSK